MDLVKELLLVCENENCDASSDLYPHLGRALRALSCGELELNLLGEVFESISTDAKLRLNYLLRLVQVRMSNRQDIQCFLDDHPVSPPNDRPVAFFHKDSACPAVTADAIARRSGLVRGLDLGKVRQLLASKLA